MANIPTRHLPLESRKKKIWQSSKGTGSSDCTLDVMIRFEGKNEGKKQFETQRPLWRVSAGWGKAGGCAPFWKGKKARKST